MRLCVHGSLPSWEPKSIVLLPPTRSWYPTYQNLHQNLLPTVIKTWPAPKSVLPTSRACYVPPDPGKPKPQKLSTQLFTREYLSTYPQKKLRDYISQNYPIFFWNEGFLKVGGGSDIWVKFPNSFFAGVPHYPISICLSKTTSKLIYQIKRKNSWAPIFDYLMLFERPLGIWRGEQSWERNFDSLTPSVKPLDVPIWGIKYLLLSLMPINTATTMAV